MKFKNKNILITGGASGMGAATVKKVLAEGGVAIIADINEDKAKAFIDSLGEAKERVIFIKVDLLDIGSIEAMAQEVGKNVSALHGVVNSAGIGMGGGTVPAVTQEIFRRGLAINLEAPVYVVKVLLPLMEKEGASVVHISSDGALKARANCLIYDATKAGLISIAKSMAAELVSKKIRVNAVAPGWTVTEFHYAQAKDPDTKRQEMEAMDSDYCMMRRLAKPSEIADGIGYLLSDESSYVTGTVLCVDGGRVGF